MAQNIVGRMRRPLFTALCALTLAGAAAPVVLALLVLPHSACAAPFNLVATHPDAAAQSTPVGRDLRTLKAFNGKLYVGYGDYDPMNTGPIAIRAFDPATGQFTGSLLSRPQPPHGAETNAMLMFREIGGNLYAPHTDPWPDPPPVGEKGGYAMGVAGATGETWSDHRVVQGIHMFDMATFDGTDLWIVGSNSPNAVAWRKRNDASGWEQSLVIAPEGDADFARFYAVHAYKGKLYVQGHDAGGTTPGPQSTSWVFDGTRWSTGPSMAGGFIGRMWEPQTFAGYMVFKRNHGGVSGRMSRFDGTTTTLLVPPGSTQTFYDYTIAGDTLYGLLTDGQILWTKDLSSWTPLDTAPAEVRSIGVLGDRLYVGGANGRLYQYSVALPEPAAVTVLGVLALLLRRRQRCA